MLGVDCFRALRLNSYNNKNNNYIQSPKNALKAPLLAPLQNDTISFSGSLPIKRDISELKNDRVCFEVRKNSIACARNFVRSLNLATEPFVCSDDNPNGAIKEIKIRLKSAVSLKEKILSELDYALEKGIEPSFDAQSCEDIKKKFVDIIGARIVLAKTNQEDTSKMIDALIEQIQNGGLKINKIQNYMVCAEPSELDYFSHGDLKRLQDAANAARKEGEPFVEFVEKSKNTGYTALHLDFDLSNDNLPKEKNGYMAELQIIGNKVEELKEVEQFCYKLKLGKTIKNSNPIYKPLVDYYKKYITRNFMYSDVEENFEKYTKRAFAIQRNREKFPHLSHKDMPLPTIEQCGFKDKLPVELDFNKLAKIKYLCDELYRETKGLYK